MAEAKMMVEVEPVVVWPELEVASPSVWRLVVPAWVTALSAVVLAVGSLA